ncbi:4'-phosphopantetheinyl transferase family protein [Streptomyces sp. NPDC059452]|uniref:4'-phosphopantetheinyl transferase family protein n=1 Tax=Streptomyces sp. NPDC059452 TaxID=3346835 RepID=UPI0036B9C895
MTVAPRPAVPVLRRGDCQLWWASAQDDPWLRTLLDDRERARAERLRHPAARSLYVGAHALARTVVAAHLGIPVRELELVAVCKQCGGAHGKPQPPAPLRLSLSHSGARVVVALAHSTDIGVDVEEIAPHTPEATERALAPPERASLAALPAPERSAGFIRYWTRKEALLKATGDGLTVPPALLHVTAPDAAPRLLSWSGPERPRLPLRLYDLDAGTGHRAALASVGAPVRLTHHDGAALLDAARGPAPRTTTCLPTRTPAPVPAHAEAPPAHAGASPAHAGASVSPYTTTSEGQFTS